MAKTKIKDMTSAQLQAYRKKQREKLKKKKEKEAKEEERQAKQRSKAAKKAAATRKKNQRKKQVTARKAAATRRKNAAAAKRELREKKKSELEKRREEKRKNKIVVPRSKPIKDMTPEEYSDYKKEYARIYNERKRKAEAKEQHKNVSRRLSGRALNIWNNGDNMESLGREFSKMTENKRYIMHPRINNRVGVCKTEGLNAYIEFTAAANLYVIGRRKVAEVSLSCFVLPSNQSGQHLAVKDFWTKDVSSMIPELTDKNFSTLLQPFTNEEFEKVMKWTTLRFMKACIDFGQRHKLQTAEILWQSLDKDYANKNKITMNTLNEMAKSRKNRVKKNNQ